MLEIHGLWIINDSGKMIYNQEIFIEDSREIDAVLLGGLLITIQKLLATRNENELKTHDLDKTKLYALRDFPHNLNYILKCHKNIKGLEIMNFFEKLKKIYGKHFGNELIDFDSLANTERVRSYKEDIELAIRSDKEELITYFFQGL